MPVVSNTSPLLNLAIIGRLDLLHDQFREVLIPPAVQRELRADEDRPGSLALNAALEQGWLKVTPLENSVVAQILWRTLDEGEAEAIALALEVGADRILLDEKDARRAAKPLGLETLGVLGVLLRAKMDGKLPSLTEEFGRLREEAGFRIGPDLERALLMEAGEVEC
jgi:uncharacterized protein